ncbi:MAG: hypothetical protein ABEH83_13280, partial [Halobacterium sp.]
MFAPDDPTAPYRTVHESWSVEFLAQLVEDGGEHEAARRAGRVVGALLALADDPARRERARDAVETTSGRVEEIAAAPGDWADATVEQLFALGERRPKLAPLYGDVDDPSFALPDACSAETALRCLQWRGRLHYLAGDYDRAEREHERLRARTPAPTADDANGASDVPEETAARLHVRALLGLLDVAETRGDYDAGSDLAARAVDAAHALG